MDEIALHILDIVQNSITAKAKCVNIEIAAVSKNNALIITIVDNGCGMDKNFLNKVNDPYSTSRSTRKVGMGIPLFKQACEITGGSLSITSALGVGTTVIAEFKLDSIDRMPLGDIGSTFVILLNNNEGTEIELSLRVDERECSFSGTEIKNTLEGIDTNQSDIVTYLTEMINENVKETTRGIVL